MCGYSIIHLHISGRDQEHCVITCESCFEHECASRRDSSESASCHNHNYILGDELCYTLDRTPATSPLISCIVHLDQLRKIALDA